MSIPSSLGNQVAFEVIDNDLTIALAAEAGQLELNVMEPIIAYNLFTSLDFLGRACRTLAERCIVCITEKSTEIANLALATGGSVYEIVSEKGYLSIDALDEILSPENMARLRFVSKGF